MVEVHVRWKKPANDGSYTVPEPKGWPRAYVNGKERPELDDCLHGLNLDRGTYLKLPFTLGEDGNIWDLAEYMYRVVPYGSGDLNLVD